MSQRPDTRNEITHKTSAHIVLKTAKNEVSETESQQRSHSKNQNGISCDSSGESGNSLPPCSAEYFWSNPRNKHARNQRSLPDSGRIVTLLRDTRHILIKPEKSAGPVKYTTTTSYNLPGGQNLPASENVKVTPQHQLPDGAVYETQTIDGNVLHTDTYYPAPGGEKTVLERTKKTTIIKAEHHQGIGPTDDKGLPVALRSTVENPKAWYKNMFKQIHKFDTDEGNESGKTAFQLNRDEQDIEPVVSQKVTYKPKKLGRITDYTPAEPYVVESKPQKSSADCSVQHRNADVGSKSSSETIAGSKSKPIKRSSSLERFIQKQWAEYFDDIRKPAPPKHIWELEADKKVGEVIPATSTSFNPTLKQEVVKPQEKKAEEPVHGTDYSVKENYTMADYVVTEPKHVVNKQPVKQKPNKQQDKRIPARGKFDFVAQSEKQLTVLKDQTVIITREVNKDWYEGETTDGKDSGIFPVAYVELLNQTPVKPTRRGLAKAKFNFTASSPKQLTVKKGESVELIERVDKNWYKGSLGGKTGILPANYIEVISEPESQKAASKPVGHQNGVKDQKTTNFNHKQSASSRSSNSEPDDKEKMTRASFLAHAVVNSGSHLSHPQQRTGEFNIPELDDEAMGVTHRVHHTPQDSYDTTLSNTSSSLHSDLGQNLYISPEEKIARDMFAKSPSESLNSDQNKDLRNQSDDSMPPTHKHVALYPYAPQNEDELELFGGDVVQVLEKCDDGWYVGTCERTGAFGTFPGNYVIAVD